jgi:hypothetical protein
VAIDEDETIFTTIFCVFGLEEEEKEELAMNRRLHNEGGLLLERS